MLRGQFSHVCVVLKLKIRDHEGQFTQGNTQFGQRLNELVCGGLRIHGHVLKATM
jgi:hypothetical protein